MSNQPSPSVEPATPTFLNVREAAETLRLGVSTLNKLRVHGGGPRYVKLGRRVVYRRIDLTTWAEERLLRSTSESCTSN